MQTHQNVLYVTTQGAYLAREGETVLVRVEHETRLRLPIHTIGAIVTFGQVSCSPPLLGFCAERGVAISFLTQAGRFLARVEGPTSGNVLLHFRKRGCYTSGNAAATLLETRPPHFRKRSCLCCVAAVTQ